ncbi:flagellar hook-length control protein FliK [Neptunomonas concharum]|uniref:Flagellar hook-length control protein-like C-terminal domain-containing protein n=1 Tax=Neptunomonas concharum TaxID=1031538 RepID=A0A5P1R843_9GAMM|nr:flagellar hook-length control protein FliK [Neptunomonas concharum]QEQ95804.1 hypothetical protein F0U83_03280 [Neptunomonas concharum]
MKSEVVVKSGDQIVAKKQLSGVSPVRVSAEKIDSPINSAQAESVTEKPTQIEQFSIGALHQPTLYRPSAGVVLQMPQGITPNHPAWPQVVSERLAWVSGQQVQSATLQLDPPELGSLQVKLQISNEQVSVTFVSPHASTRDALEQNLPRLREMLAEQGMSLGESFVNDQSSGGGKGERDESSGRMGYDLSAGEVETSSEVVSRGNVSLVDYYA